MSQLHRPLFPLCIHVPTVLRGVCCLLKRNIMQNLSHWVLASKWSLHLLRYLTERMRSVHFLNCLHRVRRRLHTLIQQLRLLPLPNRGLPVLQLHQCLRHLHGPVLPPRKQHLRQVHRDCRVQPVQLLLGLPHVPNWIFPKQQYLLAVCRFSVRHMHQLHLMRPMPSWLLCQCGKLCPVQLHLFGVRSM